MGTQFMPFDGVHCQGWARLMPFDGVHCQGFTILMPLYGCTYQGAESVLLQQTCKIPCKTIVRAGWLGPGPWVLAGGTATPAPQEHL